MPERGCSLRCRKVERQAFACGSGQPGRCSPCERRRTSSAAMDPIRISMSTRCGTGSSPVSANSPAEAHISAISTTTHGACFALTAGDALALPILDYEFDGPELDRRRLPANPRRLRRDALAGSARRSQRRPAALLAAAVLSRRLRPSDAILPYPQYWVWRLTGAQGRRGDLVRRPHRSLEPARARPIRSLRSGKAGPRLLPPLIKPWDTVGTVSSRISPRGRASRRLPRPCRHPRQQCEPPPAHALAAAALHGDIDRHLDDHLRRRRLARRARPGARLPRQCRRLRRDRCRRQCFMARPRVRDSRGQRGRADPSDEEVARVVDERIMALPAFVAGSRSLRPSARKLVASTRARCRRAGAALPRASIARWWRRPVSASPAPPGRSLSRGRSRETGCSWRRWRRW